MRFDLVKKGLAIILVLLSVLNITFFGVNDVAAWLVGPEYRNASSEEKADMILDLYVNNDFIYISDESEGFVRGFISEFLIQIFSAEGDGDEVARVLSELPVYERGERDATRVDYTTDTADNIKMKQTLRKLIEISTLSAEVKQAMYLLTDGINDVYIYFLTTDYDGVYEFAGDYVNDSGKIETGITGVYYDSETTVIYGIYDSGIFQIGFDCKASEFMMQNPVHAWQRQFGFNVLYDVLGNTLLIDTNTVRVRFEYNGVHKMFQFWKGNYTKISNGAEIGLYNRQADSLWLYDSFSDDELLYMSMKLYHGDELVLSHDRELHWWLTGYLPGPLIPAEELTLDSYIEFTEQGMLDAFIAAAVKSFGKSATVTSDGLTAHIIWK